MSTSPAQLTCPYPGLRPYSAKEDHLFFGRDEDISAVLKRMATQRLLALVGASGTGKTSLVRAGVVPALHDGELPLGTGKWRIESLRPGNAPLKELAYCFRSDYRSGHEEGHDYGDDDLALLVRDFLRREESFIELLEENVFVNHDQERPLLLVVDDIEEIFYSTKDVHVEEARAFLRLLAAAAMRTSRVPLRIILVMRAEFLGMCGAFPQLPGLLNPGLYLMPELNDKDYEEIIRGPLNLQTRTAEPELVARLLDDVRHRPDALPLLQHALSLLWHRADASSSAEARRVGDPFLTLRHYKEIGGLPEPPDQGTDVGLRGCVERNLGECVGTLKEEQWGIAKELFRKLAQPRAIPFEIRRRVTLEEIARAAKAPEEAVEKVVDAFRGPGRDFLVRRSGREPSPKDPLEVCHDSLFRLWSQYREWWPLRREDAEEMRYDVFICYHSGDRTEVLEIVESLKAEGVKVWIDDEEILPGRSFQRLINEQILSIRSAAVFLGQSLGDWQSEEMEALKHESVDRDLPVIPVVLKACKKDPETILPPLYKSLVRVDFRRDSDPLGRLFRGITGQRLESTRPPALRPGGSPTPQGGAA
jgi:hypothetical protein